MKLLKYTFKSFLNEAFKISSGTKSAQELCSISHVNLDHVLGQIKGKDNNLVKAKPTVANVIFTFKLTVQWQIIRTI